MSQSRAPAHTHARAADQCVRRRAGTHEFSILLLHPSCSILAAFIHHARSTLMESPQSPNVDHPNSV
jgi:hypothetical protein